MKLSHVFKISHALIAVSLIALILNGCSDDSVTNNNTTVQNPSPQTQTHAGVTATQWMDLLYNSVASQDINPPVGARIYAYAAVTLYECVRYGMPNYYSLSGQLNQMPPMPTISQNDIYDWPSVVTGAMPVLIRGIMDTVENITNQRINNIKSIQEQERRNAVGNEIVDRSMAYGESVANKVLEWSHSDRYAIIKTMTYVVPPRNINPAYWEPTDPGHSNPVAPFWGTVRTMGIPSGSYCTVPLYHQFDSLPGSDFYNDAMEVKNIRQNLTQEQKNTALYWNDKLRTGTPGGHWVSIMTQIVGVKNLNLAQTAEMYALGCIAIHDAFISCWDGKFATNLLRPKTFIRDYIAGNDNWEPFLTTPVFPAFTSGHSTQSRAASFMLTTLFGDVAFTDTTLIRLGFPQRSFNSFVEASNEAAMSRLYGGIHFRVDNDRGIAQGTLVAQTILSRVHLRAY